VPAVTARFNAALSKALDVLLPAKP